MNRNGFVVSLECASLRANDDSLQRPMTVRRRADEKGRVSRSAPFSDGGIRGHDVANVDHADAVGAMRAMEYERTLHRPAGAALARGVAGERRR